MLGNPHHIEIKGSLDDLLKMVSEASAAGDFFKVGRRVSEAEQLEHSGRLYIAMSGVLTTLVVKKARRAPQDALHRQLKDNIRGLHQMRLWARADPTKHLGDDGEEVISRATRIH